MSSFYTSPTCKPLCSYLQTCKQKPNKAVFNMISPPHSYPGAQRYEHFEAFSSAKQGPGLRVPSSSCQSMRGRAASQRMLASATRKRLEVADGSKDKGDE